MIKTWKAIHLAIRRLRMQKKSHGINHYGWVVKILGIVQQLYLNL